jgi:hypothetical protein
MYLFYCRFSLSGVSISNFLVENGGAGESPVFICFLKRMCYDENFFANLRIIRTFAAPQNMQGVVTS